MKPCPRCGALSGLSAQTDPPGLCLQCTMEWDDLDGSFNGWLRGEHAKTRSREEPHFRIDAPSGCIWCGETGELTTFTEEGEAEIGGPCVCVMRFDWNEQVRGLRAELDVLRGEVERRDALLREFIAWADSEEIDGSLTERLGSHYTFNAQFARSAREVIGEEPNE